jgi:hypothetical protein
MKVNQIYSLLNDINKQIWGEDALAVNDLSGIIAMGTQTLTDAFGVDKFLGTLVDRIGKTVVRTLDLELDFPSLYMNEFEFGAVLQKITVHPFDAIENAAWKVGDQNFQPTLLDIHKPNVTCTAFQGADTWKFQVTIPDDMLSTAFTSEGAMSNFITAIISAMTDSMTMAINNMSRTAINNLMAEKFKLTSNGCIDVYAAYRAAFPNDSNITHDTFLYSPAAVKFTVNLIRKYVRYMEQPNTNYNESGYVRVTQRDNMHVLVLTELAAASEAYLENDSFQNIVRLPNYTEVAYWQGNKDASDINAFDTVSAIKVTPSSEEGSQSPTDVEQTGIICLLADRQAIGVGINKRRSGSFYNSIDAYENISSSATIGYYNDLSENAVCFYIGADPTP